MHIVRFGPWVKSANPQLGYNVQYRYSSCLAGYVPCVIGVRFLLNQNLLASTFNQCLAEVLLCVSVGWAALQGNFKVTNSLHQAPFRCIPKNKEHTNINHSNDYDLRGIT